MIEPWKKFSKMEDKIMDKIAYPVLAILILLFIYSQWGHWKAWLWEVSSLLLYVALVLWYRCRCGFRTIVSCGTEKKGAAGTGIGIA